MSLTAQDLIDMRKVMATATVIQGGAFKKELDEIGAAHVELTKKLGLLASVEALEKAQKAFEASMGKREAAAKELEERTLATVAQVKKDSTALQERANALAPQEANMRTRLAKLVQDENALRKREQEATDAASQLKIVMGEKQQNLVDRENALTAREAAFAERMKRAAEMVGS